MGVLGSIDRGLTRLVSWIAQALLWSAVAAGFYQVLARFVLESPSAWSEGWTRAAIIWTVMLGVALAFRQGAMLGVDLLHNLLAPRRARVLEHVVLLIVVGFLGFLVWIGADMTWRVRFQTTPSMGISISWIYLSIPVGATLALFAALAYWAEGPRRPHIETV
ncbi:TRAP transporter small permease [Castellaniella daejeonensis]|jgi:TRAP-type C4-dicarboxylate transport system permease small subunit|uniref:TRAP transporter small permease protein n=1 Tax=Castellaniella daejeonensis TaxID=659013 RepID=A0ABP3DEI7_9BURK|nr:TRAP transporter small permease [Castellaniella sp.]HET8702342.1 TRAP transporter small permease [Castellaniella sp.]